MADSGQSSSPLSAVVPLTEDVFMTMPEETREIIQNYKEINGYDYTKLILWNTYQHLPSDGRMNLNEDIIEAAANDRLCQLASSIVEGLLKPLKVNGAQTARITPSPRSDLAESLEDLGSRTDQPMQRRQREIKAAAMARDNGRCVISGQTESQAYLEAAHIVPFALAKWDSSIERDRKICVWDNMLRYFPSLTTRLNFYYQQINDLENVMMLHIVLHLSFGSFNLALEETATLNEYRIKTFRGFRTGAHSLLPASGTVVFTAHDGRFPLPSPELLKLHCAVANILHASGMAEQIDKLLDDNDAIGGFAPNGSTDLAALLSVTKIAMVPSIRQKKQLETEDLKTSAITEESKENQPGRSSVH